MVVVEDANAMSVVMGCFLSLRFSILVNSGKSRVVLLDTHFTFKIGCFHDVLHIIAEM